MIDDHYQRQARQAMLKGYYQLNRFDTLRASDLVWDWTSCKWLRADSPEWKFDSFSVPMDEIICAIRKAEMEFGEVKKVYRMGQGRLF